MFKDSSSVVVDSFFEAALIACEGSVWALVFVIHALSLEKRVY